MGFVEVEAVGKRMFERFPFIKHTVKRFYQGLSVATSKEKLCSEGELIKVSPNDNYEYFYGYYDKSPWDVTERYMICLRVNQTYKSVAPKEPGTVCLINTANNNALVEIGMTHSWNVQQGCMAQWLGPDFKSRIMYNDYRDGKYCSVIYNVRNMREEKILPFPVYDVSRDGSYALSLDFSRLHRMRPGYGYSNLPDSTKGELCPEKCCIWKIDIHSGKVTELLKYTDFAAFEPDETMKGAEHKVNHLMISPNGERFMVLHRWFQKGRKHTRLVTVNADGTGMYNLSDDVFVSHCFWKNDKEILSFLRKKDTGDHYYLMTDKAQEYKLLWPELNTDGHCSYSPDGKFVVTDTYPNRKRIASVYLCTSTEGTNQSRRIARVFSPFKYDNDCRCDLHPRWNRSGNKICIDSVHEGKRGVYVIDCFDMVGSYSSFYREETGKRNAYKNLTDRVIGEISSFNYVSFDIFDTLLKRDVPDPHSIFYLMEDMLERKLGLNIDNFYRKRIEAERIARKEAKNKEITLCDIYASAKDELIRKNAVKFVELEKELEFRASYANYPMFEVYNWCLKNNKHIILISDMYLDEDFVALLLLKNGYENYEKIFISSTWKKRKADNGALFCVACSELNIRPGELIHIGDSKISDGRMPEKIGCKSSVIPGNLGETQFFLENSSYRNLTLSYKILRSFCKNRSIIKSDYYYSFGYEAFGPLLAGYSKWLYSEIKKGNIVQLYFFSRDGLIIKKAFDLLYSHDETVQTNYLLVSRRSLRVPQIWLYPDYFDVIKGFPEASMQSIITFFDTLGLDFKDYRAVCERLGIDEQYTYKKNGMTQNRELISLYDEIKIDVIRNSKREYTALLTYLKEKFYEKRIAVIDIGWRGSMQKFLMDILDSANIDIDLFGYYIGLSSGARKYSEERHITFKGYLFDCNANPNKQDMHSPFVGLLETLFLAREGSTKRYFSDVNGNVKVEFYDNEYVTETGTLTDEANKVALLQKGALQFVNDYKGSILSELEFDPGIVFRNIYEVGMRPSKTDLRKFGDMKFCDGEMLKLAAPKSLMSYCKNPKGLVRDFYNSRWKIGFMKRLLKIPFPYGALYRMLKKL